MQNTTTSGTIEIMSKDNDDDSSIDSSKDNANAKDNPGIPANDGNPGAPGGENNIGYAENDSEGKGVSNGNEQESIQVRDLEKTALDNSWTLALKRVAISGFFPHLEEGKGLNVGKAAVAELISRHGGMLSTAARGNRDMLVVGHRPGQTNVFDTKNRSIKIMDLDGLEQLLSGALSYQEFVLTSPPVISEYSAGFQLEKDMTQPKPGHAQDSGTPVEAPEHPALPPTRAHIGGKVLTPEEISSPPRRIGLRLQTRRGKSFLIPPDSGRRRHTIAQPTLKAALSWPKD
jgi:hypothetical protein